MPRFDRLSTVGEIVSSHPASARLFEQYGIDYCCRGKQNLAEACQLKGIDAGQLLTELATVMRSNEVEKTADLNEIPLSTLADHIEDAHHSFLRRELPRLQTLVDKVATAHGQQDPRLEQMRHVVTELAEELSCHMIKEERILFPSIRELEQTGAAREGCGLEKPIRQMEVEHAQVAAALEDLRSLTDGYTPPHWACTTYRVLLEALHELEQDLHRQIHKENCILFPRAMALMAKQ